MRQVHRWVLGRVAGSSFKGALQTLYINPVDCLLPAFSRAPGGVLTYLLGGGRSSIFTFRPIALGRRGRASRSMPPARKKRAAPTPAAPSPEEPEPDGPPSKRVGRRVPAAAAAPPPPPVPLLSPLKYVSVVNELLNMEAAAPFAEPLDYAAIGCHDYPKVVKHPMDLGTIKSKLGDGSYQRGEDVLKDVRRLGQLHARCTAYHMRTVCAPHAHRMRTACTHQVRRVFDNCYLYNGAVTTGHWVSLKANEARSRRDLAAISRLPRRAARPQTTAPPA